jgi:hypothetical protein
VNFIQTFGDVRSTDEMISLLAAAQPTAKRA